MSVTSSRHHVLRFSYFVWITTQRVRLYFLF